MRFRGLLRRARTPLQLAILVVAVVVAFRLGADSSPARQAMRERATAHGNVRALDARLPDGRVVPLAPSGEPVIVMVSSVTCTYCDEALRDFARMANGAPLPRLRVVTLEGASAGAPMLASRGLARVWQGGPVGDASRALLTFQFAGTPTFLYVDGSGEVRAALVGYPGREAIAPWFAVMAGRSESPPAR